MSTALIEQPNAADQIEAIAALPTNIAVMRMENDTMQAMAVARPRDMVAIKEELETTLAAFPVLAESAIYSKPVGKVIDHQCNDCRHRFEAALKKNNSGYAERCPKCDSQQTKALGPPRQKFARGFSIRAAETLREVYGYNRVDCDLERIDDKTYKVIATFTDFQRGTVFRSATIASKTYTDRYGKSSTKDDGRFFGLDLKSEQSKTIREVVCRSVNAGLKLWFYEECEKLQENLLTDEAIEKTITAFEEFELTQDDLERIIGRTRKSGWNKNDRRTLIGIYNGLQSGEIRKDELFADEGEPESKADIAKRKIDERKAKDSTGEPATAKGNGAAG